jgi:hypothetical protein
MTIIFDEDKLVDDIIEAASLEPVEGAEGAVMQQFEMEKDTVSVEIIRYLSVWGASLVLSNNFTVEKHSHCFMLLAEVLKRRLGIREFCVMNSHGEKVNGYDFEKHYDKEWEKDQRRYLDHT